MYYWLYPVFFSPGMQNNIDSEFHFVYKGGTAYVKGAAMSAISLREMHVDQSGTIAAINAHGELGRRIRDMGLVPGAPVTVVGRAPLRDPVAIRLRDSTLALRNNEADLINVNVDDAPADPAS